MTRKDLEAIAAALKSTGASKDTCAATADYFVNRYPRFNYSRFMDACGYPLIPR